MLAFIIAFTLAAISPNTAAMLPGRPVNSVIPKPASAAPAPEHKIYGNVVSVNGSTLVLRTRTGHRLIVDGHLAHSFVLLSSNRPVIVFGTLDANGVIHARAVWHTFPDAVHWPADE